MSLGRNFFLLAAILGLTAVLYSFSSRPPVLQHTQPPRGRNNSVLIITDNHRGFANVLLATSHALLLEHSDISIDFASFPLLESAVSEISSSAIQQSSGHKPKPIKFHPLAGDSYTAALFKTMDGSQGAMHQPGIAGLGKFLKNMQMWLMPWSGPEYVALYQTLCDLLEDIDPAVVAIDPMFAPALNAIRKWGGKYVIMSPNSLLDIFSPVQPRGEMLWKYPMGASGYPFPLPWYLIPANTYIALRYLYTISVAPDLWKKRAYVRNHGIEKALDTTSVYENNDRCLWLSQSMKEAAFPLSVVPQNALQVGPIYLSTAPAAQQDPELASWLERRPTVLINMGSVFDYDEEDATKIVESLRTFFDNVDGVQVLWKLKRRNDFGDEFLASVGNELRDGRLRLETWLAIDPGAIMETGNVACMLHHGGASSYGDALGAGVPHIVLGLWVDTYNQATLVEWLGIGVWANRRSAPRFNSEELGAAFVKVCGQGNEGMVMRAKAEELRAVYRADPGRSAAAREIARIARTGGH